MSYRLSEKFGIIFASDMCMLDEIRAKRDEIYAIAKRHDDSHVRHMLDAMERITELSRGFERGKYAII